jgi:hypothetical protein
LSQTLTPQEREHASAELRRTAAALIEAATAVAGEWSTKPSPESWSAAEICEHVWRVDRGVFLRIRRTPESDGAVAIVDTQQMLSKARARTKPAQAPEIAIPTGEFPTVDAFRDGYEETIRAICDYIATTEHNLHRRITSHAMLGPMSGYQWILFLAAHCERHTTQLITSRPSASSS